MDQEEIAILKSILACRSNTGTTLPEIQSEFLNLTGELPSLFSINSYTQIHDYLAHVPDIHLEVRNGVFLWFSTSTYTKHISDMVVNQKCKVPPTKCFFADNDKFRRTRRRYQSSQKSTNSSGSNFSLNTCDSANTKGATFHEYELYGDDFFMLTAVANLKNKYTSVRGVRRSGLCVSGQTISQLTNRIKTAETISRNVILNIGSVDILNGRELLDIQDDFNVLINTLENRNVNYIITTLAPLANLAHYPEASKKLRRFNYFLKQQYSFVVDIWQGFMNGQNQIIYDFYQYEPTYVSGSCQPHLLWNKLGRQIVIKILNKAIADIVYGPDDYYNY